MSSQAKILEEWYRDIRVQADGHKLAAGNCHKANRRLGIPVVALSAIVGSSMFTMMQQSSSNTVRLVVGGLSICAAVLAGLQTFLKYSELAERHKTASIKFGELSRELQQIQGSLDSNRGLDDLLDDLRTRWNALEEQSPTLSAKILQRVGSVG